MIEVTALTCTKCGSQLELPIGISQFACSHCGVQHTVNRGGGIVSIEPIVEGLDEIREGTDRTSSELALPRLDEELAAIKLQLQAVEAEGRLTSIAGVITGGIVILVGLPFLYVGINYFGIGEILPGLVSLIIGLLVVGAGIFIIRKRGGEKKRLQSQVSSLKQQYADKSAEIDHHKKVVSMPMRQEGASIVS